jgi:3-oxoacyl-[acyl-carrier-protein] synthase-1
MTTEDMELGVTGIGMATSLGLDAVTSCSAARAGLQRPKPHPSYFAIVEEGAPPPQAIPVVVHAVPKVASGFFGYGRRLQIASAALADLVSTEGWQDHPRTGFILLVGNNAYRRAFLQSNRDASKDADESTAAELAEYESFVDYLDSRFANELPNAILKRVPVQVAGTAQLALVATTTGLGEALDQARAWVRSQVCDRCILGEVDSLVDVLNVEALDGLGLLKTSERPAALSPGESATFVVVSPIASAERRGDAIHAVLGGHRIGLGPAHPRISRKAPSREALADMVSELASEVSPQDGIMLVANLNGDPHRSAAFSQIFYQAKDERLRAPAYWVPAQSFGDTGAACGLTSVAMLARGWQRNYAPSPNAFVCLQDDWGGRLVIGARAH